MKNHRVLSVLTSIVVLALITGAGALYADSQKPVSGSCGSTSGGCGSPATVQNLPDQLNLTEAQTRQLAEIDAKYSAEEKTLRDKLSAKTKEAAKLIDDPKSKESAIRKKMHERAILLADLQLCGIFAQRAKEKVYTSEQKEILAKSTGGCGCGSGDKNQKPSSGGGCGSLTGGCGGG